MSDVSVTETHAAVTVTWNLTILVHLLLGFFFLALTPEGASRAFPFHLVEGSPVWF